MKTKLAVQAVKVAHPRTARYAVWDTYIKRVGLRVNADSSKS
jgi:hypothetical protein